MIIKYLNEETWNYIDHVKKVEKKMFNSEQLLREYEERVAKRNKVSDYKESDDCTNMTELSQKARELREASRILIMILEKTSDGCANRHFENSISAKQSQLVHTLILHVDDGKESKIVLLATNQSTYIMNDNGRTIESIA